MTLPEILNHLGEEHERYFGAVAPPIIQTSNFCYRTVAEMRNALRGLRTIHLRLERSSNSALALAGFLEKHPKVGKVFYPFLASHPQYELARRQMKFAGGLFSVILKATSPEDIERFSESLKMFLLAVSWGGYESLVFPAIAFSRGEKADSIPWNLVRFYIGLEDPEVLRYDLENAMKLL